MTDTSKSSSSPDTPVPDQSATDQPSVPLGNGVSRRSFMQTLGVSAAASAVGTAAEAAASELQQQQQQRDPEMFGPDPQQITLRINGKRVNATIDPATTLMETLRWHVRMTGTKEVCDRGACGACSVMVDGTLVASCMMLAVDAMDAEITTVEGLAAEDGTLDPVQEAFVKHDALQCGFCTPGLVVASKALLEKNPKPSLPQIRHGLSGNLCRCGTYNNVFNAVLEASGQSPTEDDVKGGM